MHQRRSCKTELRLDDTIIVTWIWNKEFSMWPSLVTYLVTILSWAMLNISVIKCNISSIPKLTKMSASMCLIMHIQITVPNFDGVTVLSSQPCLLLTGSLHSLIMEIKVIWISCMLNPHLITFFIERVKNCESYTKIIPLGFFWSIPSVLDYYLSNVIFFFIDFVEAKICYSIDTYAPVINFNLTICHNIDDAVLILEIAFETWNEYWLGRNPKIIFRPFKLKHNATIPITKAFSLTRYCHFLIETYFMLNFKIYFIYSLLFAYSFFLSKRVWYSKHLLFKLLKHFFFFSSNFILFFFLFLLLLFFTFFFNFSLAC